MPNTDTRHADLVRRSDVLLHRLEKLTLDAYRPYRPEQPPVGGVRKVVACRLSWHKPSTSCASRWG